MKQQLELAKIEKAENVQEICSYFTRNSVLDMA